MTSKIRQPIVVLVGHVDHGKSSIIEKIREISITKDEAGGITQKISSINVPLPYIKKFCGKLFDQLKIRVNIPGLLLIDTPGHAAFTNLRKRGGSLADIAILVIDINEGIKPQTLEAIEILKGYKTPFVVALNKIDLITGWKRVKPFLLENIKVQTQNIQEELDKRLYNIVGKLYELGFNSERYDRIEDYTKQVALILCSAKTTEGIAELLMVLTGLAQRYLEKRLKIEVEGPGKGTILEVSEEKGMGTTMDVIIYDGSIKINDQIVIGGLENPIVTNVKALFEVEKNKLKKVKESYAASGIKINAPGIKDVIAGMPLRVANTNLEIIEKEIKKEVQEILIQTDKDGVIVKADSLGSLEALVNLLKGKKISIKRAGIGNITKRDVAEAQAEENPLHKVILGFNIKQEAKDNVKVINSNIIYKVIEDFDKWQKEELENIEEKELKDVTFPCKIKLMMGYVFRQSNPAIIGVDVIAGRLTTNIQLMKNGKPLTSVKEIQHEKENVKEVGAGKQIAVALTKVTIGRQINENDILYSFINEDEFRKLKKLKRYLNSKEIELLKEIAQIMRKENPTWGV